MSSEEYDTRNIERSQRNIQVLARQVAEKAARFVPTDCVSVTVQRSRLIKPGFVASFFGAKERVEISDPETVVGYKGGWEFIRWHVGHEKKTRNYSTDIFTAVYLRADGELVSVDWETYRQTGGTCDDTGFRNGPEESPLAPDQYDLLDYYYHRIGPRHEWSLLFSSAGYRDPSTGEMRSARELRARRWGNGLWRKLKQLEDRANKAIEPTTTSH